VFMRVKTNPQPFTMRLCLAFVNGKTDNCSVFPLFFLNFSQFCQFEAKQRPPLFSTEVTSGVFIASTSGLSSRKQRITSFAKSFFSTSAGAILASTPPLPA
jgi:hypothetical protein